MWKQLKEEEDQNKNQFMQKCLKILHFFKYNMQLQSFMFAYCYAFQNRNLKLMRLLINYNRTCISISIKPNEKIKLMIIIGLRIHSACLYCLFTTTRCTKSNSFCMYYLSIPPVNHSLHALSVS